MCVFWFPFTHDQGMRGEDDDSNIPNDDIHSCASYIFTYDIPTMRSKGENWLSVLSKAGRPRLSLSKVEALETTERSCSGANGRTGRLTIRMQCPDIPLYSIKRHSSLVSVHWILPQILDLSHPSELCLVNDNLHYQKGHCDNGGFSEINQQLQFLREGLISSNAISLYSKNSQGHIMKGWRGNDRSSRGLEREVS